MKQITAYYCSWCFPALMSGEKPHTRVSIQYEDDTWEEIFRMALQNSIDRESQNSCARTVLEHYLGELVCQEQIDALVNMPGQSLCRLEPKVLQQFKQGMLFADGRS